jgi:hypothetical protein
LFCLYRWLEHRRKRTTRNRNEIGKLKNDVNQRRYKPSLTGFRRTRPHAQELKNRRKGLLFPALFSLGEERENERDLDPPKGRCAGKRMRTNPELLLSEEVTRNWSREGDDKVEDGRNSLGILRVSRVFC